MIYCFFIVFNSQYVYVFLLELLYLSLATCKAGAVGGLSNERARLGFSDRPLFHGLDPGSCLEHSVWFSTVSEGEVLVPHVGQPLESPQLV